ncbi:enterotoxin type A [Leptotrichia sp. OH3620_COT-345]|nr:enterotoxin type A [Leptotrichia sp. OH3620_COT-345]RRD39287.1 enterotoxin type A [Leptotrichia sp. OH3620_COT-345]
MFNKYLENQKKEIEYLKIIAKRLESMNKELKEENDRWKGKRQ